MPFAGSKALYDAAEFAAKQKPKAERADVPPGSDVSPAKADKQNDSSASDRYYLFGPDRYPIGNDGEPLREGELRAVRRTARTCWPTTSRPAATPNKYAKDTECLSQLEALGSAGPPPGSRVFKVPRGIVVVEGEPAPNQSERVHRFFVIEDDSELNGKEIKNPEQAFDPNTNEPLVNMEFTDKGREAFARRDEADRRPRARLRDARRRRSQVPAAGRAEPDDFFQRFAITLDNQIVSLATIDYQENPDGIDGRNGASIQNIGDIGQAQDLAENLRIGALPIDLKLISQTQVSATLGQQALDQGLTAAAAGLALTILFLLLFYRVLGLVATVALLIYAALLFALVKLIPITLTLPGIAGMVLTLAVAADANIVMYERIKEEVRSGRSVPAAISAGYTKALRTIIDANVVTIGVAFILFTLATAGVQGLRLHAGCRNARLAVHRGARHVGHPRHAGAHAPPAAAERAGCRTKGDREGWKFDFMGNSRWFFSFSGAILAAGAIAIAALGLNFGIDFESGTRMTAPLQQAASVDEVRDTLEPLGYARRRDPGGHRTRSSARTSCRSRCASSTRRRSPTVRERARRGLSGWRRRDFVDELRRADLRRADRADGA